ncbi:MAG TPA: polysaccharide lyase family protein [Terriglobia bacterium]|nr:polysaccharide lyase family protein [Terriglobia bacterium]
MIRKRLPVAVLMLGGLLSPLFSKAAERSVWKIGTFNHSSSEFRDRDIAYADPKSDPTYVIGKSKEQDWYRFQPGPANEMTGGRYHPFTVEFALPDTPSGVYYLKIAVLYETPRLSFLQLDVNGQTGVFYFHPKLDFSAGDWEGTFVPQTSADEKTIAIPAAWLHRGENRFLLTALDDPAGAQNSFGAIAPGHTGLVYDALELTQDPEAHYNEQAFTARIEPTIFYRALPGGTVEIVDVFLQAGRLEETGNVELTIGSTSFEKQFSTASSFGELRLSFAVPEWYGVAPASVSLGKLRVTSTVEPAKKWTVAIIPHEHLDVGFTDYAAKVAELHSQSVDGAIDLIRRTPDFRWTLDGSWVATAYLKGRSPEAREQFLQHVRDGSIVIPPELANQHTGNASWEALARSFYNQRKLSSEFRLPAGDAAQIVDVPSYTWAYASILHDAGIKYLIAASNSWRAPGMLFGRWNEKSPFYWEGPDGGRVLMWYSRAYLQLQTLFGSPWRMEAIRDALPVFLQAYTRPDYTASTVIVFGTQLENTPLAPEQSEIVAAVSGEYAWPRFQFATVHSAMAQIEHEWKGEIPVYRGDFGPYWEDGYGSDAASTSIHRQNQHRIATAEVLGSAVTSLDPRVSPDRSTLQDAWWNELIYDEHTWTFVGATTQPEHRQSVEQMALKASRARRAQNDIDESLQRSWAQLEALVKPKETSVAVWNSLNWPRSGIVETDLPEGSTLVDPSTGQEVAMEVLWKGKGIPLPGFGPVNIRVRFLARDVPAVGYKLFTVKPSGPRAEKITGVRGNILENQFYRVTVDANAGVISSIFDKELGRELVDPKSPYKFGAYLYVTGGDQYPRNSLYRFGAGLKPPNLTAHPAGSGALVSAKRTLLGTVARLRARAWNTPAIELEILLPDHEKQILLTYHIRKEPVLTRESAYVAFPFAVSAPQFAYGSQTAWVNPAKDELPGGSREWYLPTTWAAVSNHEVTAAVVPIDSPLVTFGDITRGTWPADFTAKSSTIFSWLMNNYWGTNFPAWQGGDFTFRYAITSSSRFEPTSLNRTGWNALTPLEKDDVGASNDGGVLPDKQAGLLDVGNPDVNLLTWKVAEDGDGTILRLQETAGTPSRFNISSRYLQIEQVWSCNLLEENQAPLETSPTGVTVSMQPFQVLTLRLRTSPRPAKEARP